MIVLYVTSFLRDSLDLKKSLFQTSWDLGVERQFRLEGHNTFFTGMLGRHFGKPYNLEMLKLLFVFWRLHFRIQLISVISGLRDLLWTTGQKAFSYNSSTYTRIH